MIDDKKLEVGGKRRGETKCEKNTGENSAERYGKIKKPTMRGKAQCLLRGQKKAARSQAQKMINQMKDVNCRKNGNRQQREGYDL